MDIDLPGMDGIRTAEILTSMNPSQCVLFVSAFPEKARAVAGRKGLSLSVMRKPIDLDRCLLTVASLLP